MPIEGSRTRSILIYSVETGFSPMRKGAALKVKALVPEGLTLTQDLLKALNEKDDKNAQALSTLSSLSRRARSFSWNFARSLPAGSISLRPNRNGRLQKGLRERGNLDDQVYSIPDAFSYLADGLMQRENAAQWEARVDGKLDLKSLRVMTQDLNKLFLRLQNRV